MTPKQVALVQDSFAKVALTSEAAAVLFYDRLFDIAPQMKAMFPDDMIEQRRKLMAMLAGVVKGLANLEQVLPAASALAKRHVSYGAKAEHYPVVGAALLWTLEKGLGDGWTPEVADAWGTAYGTLSGYMISEAYSRSQAPSKDYPVSEPLVIVGNGMAAARLVDELTAPLRLNVPGADLRANCSIPQSPSQAQGAASLEFPREEWKMAELIEHGLSFTEQRPDGSHKLGKRAVVIGAGIGGLATAGALAQYFEQVDILERDRLAATAGSRSGTPQDRHPHGLLAGGLRALDQIFPGFKQ